MSVTSPQTCLIQSALTWHRQGRPQPAPNAQDLIPVLLQAERQGKKHPPTLDQLIGDWQLIWVASGKSPKRDRARWLPSWLEIVLGYTSAEHPDTGRAHNQVKLGPLQLCLSGPALKYAGPLAFDFTHLTIHFGSVKLFAGPIRGGVAQDEAFFTQSLKEQAFFSFFWHSEDGIAARGKGGGLALWARTER